MSTVNTLYVSANSFCLRTDCLFFEQLHFDVCKKSKTKLNYDRQSVGQSVLVSGTHLGPANNFCFCLKFSLDSCGFVFFVAPSLTRGRVCNLLLLLVLARAVPRNSRPYFIVPILETPPTWRTRSPYLYPPGTGWPSYTPGHWVPFPSPLTTRGATVEVFYPASTRELICVYDV
jgi:hypothetical protein